MSFDTTISTTLRLNGVAEFVGGLTSARSAMQALNGQKATIQIDDGGAKAKLAGITSEAQKLSRANLSVNVSGTQSVSAATQQMSGLNAELARMRGLAAAGAELAAIGYGLVKVVQPAATVQQNLRDIQILAGGTTEQIAKLGQAATTFTDMGKGAGEATDAMVELARAGVDVGDAARVARDAIALSTAGQIDAGAAANALTDTIHAFNLSMQDSGRVANLYAGAANASSATTQGLVMAMAQAGQASSSMGQSVETTLATLALFADRGLKGSDAGTSLRTMMLRLVPTSAQAKDTMTALGLSFTDAQGKILPLTEVAQNLHEKLSGLSEAQRTNALQTLFGTDAFRAANILYQQGAQGIDKYRGALNQVTAEQVAQQRQQTLTGSLAKLRAEWENTRVALGNSLIPTFTQVANGLSVLNNIFQNAPKGVIELTADLIALGAALKAVGVVSTIGQGLLGFGGGKAQTASTVGKTLVPLETQIAVTSVETVAAQSTIRAAVMGLGELIGPILVGVTVGLIIAKTVEIPAGNALISKVAQDTVNKDSVLLKAVRGQTDRLNSDSQQQLEADKDIIMANLKNLFAQAQKEVEDYSPSPQNALLKKLGFVDPHEVQLLYQREQAALALVQANERINPVALGPAIPDNLTTDAHGAVASMEEIKAAAKDAQGTLSDLGKAFDETAVALGKIDSEHGLQGLTKELPALKDVQATLKALGVDNRALDQLTQMAQAVANLDTELQAASGAYNGFNAQFTATQSSIGFLDDFLKKAKEVRDAASSAAKGGVATDDQLTLLKQYPAILDNVNAMIEKLHANQAGDILGMAHNLPNLIAFDQRLRDLATRYGGARALQIEIQLEVNEALAQNKIDTLIGGLTGKDKAIAATIDVAVKGDAEATAALNKIRGTVQGIPSEKEVKALATVLGIKDIQELSLLIAGINSKTVTVTAHVQTVRSGGLDIPTGPIGAPYASGGNVTGNYAIVGDAPGGGITPYTEVVDFASRHVYSNAQARRMGLFGQGLAHYESGTADDGLPGIGTIDVTVPGTVRRQYGGPGTGVGAVSPTAVAQGTAAVKEQAKAVEQLADKLIDASAAAHTLAGAIARMDAGNVRVVTQQFSAMYDYLKKASEINLTKTGDSATDTAAALAATKASAQGAVEYAVAFAQGMVDARNPAVDMAATFDKIRATGGPLAENAIRYLSIQREINITTKDMASLQDAMKNNERLHAEGVAATNEAIKEQQRLVEAEVQAEEAASRARDRANTRADWARTAQRTAAQRTFDEGTRNRQAEEQALQRRWAAEATQATAAKAIRDRAFTEAERQRADTRTRLDQSWTIEQRQFADRQTYLERYGTARKQQLADEKTALDAAHKAAMGQLDAQSQVLAAGIATSTSSADKLSQSVALAATKQVQSDIDTLYNQAIDANKAAADAEEIRAKQVLADLQDEILAATRKHEDALAQLAAEAEAASRKHDDEETRIAAEATRLDEQHQARLQQMQDEDARRDLAHQHALDLQADQDAARQHAYQEESWRIEDTNRIRQAGYSTEIKRLQEAQANEDLLYEKERRINQDALDTDQKRLDALNEEQGYLQSVLDLWKTLYDVAGDTANEVLTILSGNPPIGASIPGKASGGTNLAGLLRVHADEVIYAGSPINVLPKFAADALGNETPRSGMSVGQIGPFIQSGLSYAQYRQMILDQLDAWARENSLDTAANLMGVRS